MRGILQKIPGLYLLSNALDTVTFRQSSITFLGTVANGLFGAIFYILAARFLGPASFGLLNVAITTLTLTSDIGDLGTDAGLVNFLPRYINKEVERVKKFLKLGLKVKIAVSIFVLVSGFLLAPYLANEILRKPELITSLRIAFLGVGALLLFSYIIHVLQAIQRFWAWSIIQVSANILRVVLVVGLVVGGIFSLEGTLWAYILVPLIGFGVGLFIIRPGFLKVKGELEVAREFFSYNKWVAAFVLLAAVSSRLDTYISARLLDANELGIYSAAQQMVKIVPMIVVAMGTVVAPKMASVSNVKGLVEYIKKTQIMVLGLAFLGVLTVPFVLWSIPYLFGFEYLASGPLFVVLLMGGLTFLISVPVHMAVFYYFSYPQLFVWLSLFHLLLIALLGWNLISSMGAMGAAVTVLIGQIFNFIVPLIWVLRKIKINQSL